MEPKYKIDPQGSPMAEALIAIANELAELNISLRSEDDETIPELLSAIHDKFVNDDGGSLLDDIRLEIRNHE